MGWVSWPLFFCVPSLISGLLVAKFGRKWGFWNFLKKLLAQFISYLAFTLMGWVSWLLYIFVFLASFSALWWPNIWPKIGCPELFKKTIGSIHYIPGIYPYGVSLLTPIQFLAATKQLYDWYFLSVCLSVLLSITPFWLCSYHRIIMKFSEVITTDQGNVHAKGQGQRSKVKVIEVNTQL